MSDVLNDIALAFGVLLVLKKVAEMERYHNERVMVITVVLCIFVLVFFVGFTLGNLGYYDCVLYLSCAF